jgi:polyhydroxybutyrate depolymerase
MLAFGWLFLATLALQTGSSVASPSGCGGEIPCAVKYGSYLIEMPPGRSARGVYLFFHGYQSSASLQMKDRALVEVAFRHGLAFAAVDGLDGTWSPPNTQAHQRDDIAFSGAVLDDLQLRFGFTSKDVVIGGFSLGASMAWYTICKSGNRVSGAVTFSGVFWDPLPGPRDCPATPPPLIHFHGRADHTFPLAGRAVGNMHQGNTFDSMTILQSRAGCSARAAPPVLIGGIPCQVADGCSRGQLALCLHDGGHIANPDWLDAALSRLGR